MYTMGIIDKLKRPFHILKNKFAGMWTTSLYLGMFAGSTFGGIMVEHYGFRTTTVALFTSCCLGVVLSFKSSRQNQEKYESLKDIAAEADTIK